MARAVQTPRWWEWEASPPDQYGESPRSGDALVAKAEALADDLPTRLPEPFGRGHPASGGWFAAPAP